MLIEGPPGIGKSRLLAEFRRRATPRARSCSTRARASSSASSRSASSASCSRASIADPAALAGAAAAARVVFASPDDGAPAGGDASFAALHGLYWLALNLAAERPLLLEVDDLHWCDRPSLRFLAYLVRRLEGQPVLVTASVRTGDAADRRRAARRDRQRPGDRARPARPAERGGGRRARRRAGSAPSPTARSARPATARPAATRCSSASCSTRWRPTPSGPTPRTPTSCARSARAPSRAPCCCGSRGCPARPRRVARAVAVLGEGAELPAVAGVAGLDEAQVAGAMAALARAEILRPEPPPGFVHPLVRDAVYQGLPLGERELLHARAARRAARRAAPSLDQVAGQLMHTPRRGDADGRAAAARGRHRGDGARRDRQRGRLPAARARGAAAGRPTARSCCSTSARSRRSRAGPTAREHLREAYEGLTDVAAARARRERARPRAAVHLLAGRGRRGGPRGRARPAAGAWRTRRSGSRRSR